MKVRKILAAVLVMVVLVSLAGCNYVSRPSGVANYGSDISDKLSSLLIIPDYQYEDPTTKNKTWYEQPKEEEPEPDPEPEPEPEPEPDPDPVYTPFTSTYSADELLSKIENLISTMKVERGVANSATGVSDELLNGRAVKILVPDDFPIEEENEAVKAMTAQYGCAVNVRRVGTGSAYVAACRRAVLSGDDVDLMYVDNSIWGDVHSFTQSINSFVNLELADELNTFSSSFSEKFYVKDDLDETLIYYHVAAGMGAPYLLAYNKANVKAATLAEETQVSTAGVATTLREIAVSDPVEMYNNRTWSVSALTEMLKASTTGTNVGIASELDALEGLDIWYGMENYGGFAISANTGKATITTTSNVDYSKSADAVQSWYWTVKGVENKNYVGSFEKASAWEDESVYEKLFNAYAGEDSVKSYSFLACELEDLLKVKEVADKTVSEWDFVAYPYGTTFETTYRALTEEEFTQKVQAEQESEAAGEEYEKEIITPVAGWAGGFAVMKTCENPSVALRVAEEYTKIWKNEHETPVLEQLTADQQERYEDMKKNIGVSFVRAWAEKAADVNAVYPDCANYLYGATAATGSSSAGTSITTQNPDAHASDRSYFLGLSFFDNNANLVTHAMYHKNEANGIYDPSIHTTFSAFMEGAPSQTAENVKDSGRVAQILNASLLPGLVLFKW